MKKGGHEKREGLEVNTSTDFFRVMRITCLSSRTYSLSLFIHSNYNLWPLYNTLSPSSLQNAIELLLLLLLFVSPPLVTRMPRSFMCLLLFPWFPVFLSFFTLLFRLLHPISLPLETNAISRGG